MRPAAIDWTVVPVEHVLDGIQRQTVHGDHQTLVRYVYQPGAVFPVHCHPEEQITIVLIGTIDFMVDGRSLTLTAGQSAMIPSHLPHSASVTGSEVVETLNTMAPPRSSAPLSRSPKEDAT